MLSRVELFEHIRRDRRADPSLSRRELARRHGVARRTVNAALASAVPPTRKRQERGRRLVLEPVLGVVDEMLRADLTAPRKQQHTIERICQRLAIEYDFAEASYSAVRSYVARRRPQIIAEARAGQGHLQGMVPQVHAPGAEALCGVPHKASYAVCGNMRRRARRRGCRRWPGWHGRSPDST